MTKVEKGKAFSGGKFSEYTALIDKIIASKASVLNPE